MFAAADAAFAVAAVIVLIFVELLGRRQSPGSRVQPTVHPARLHCERVVVLILVVQKEIELLLGTEKQENSKVSYSVSMGHQSPC